MWNSPIYTYICVCVCQCSFNNLLSELLSCPHFHALTHEWFCIASSQSLQIESQVKQTAVGSWEMQVPPVRLDNFQIWKRHQLQEFQIWGLHPKVGSESNTDSWTAAMQPKSSQRHWCIVFQIPILNYGGYEIYCAPMPNYGCYGISHHAYGALWALWSLYS